MWNPPWILNIFSPLLQLDYHTAYLVLFALSLSILLITIEILSRYIYPQKNLLLT